MNYSKIRGFNYQPSYGSTSFENWLYFDPEIVELELRRGKQYFPNMNSIRLWLSWSAYRRDPEKFEDNFEKALNISDRLDLKVIPVLFNRWHNSFLDCGGIYIDHFKPGWSWITRQEQFKPYVKSIVSKHKNDDRILLWDLCNEPFSYDNPIEDMREIEQAEYNWLERMYNIAKDQNPNSPLGISLHPGHGKKGLERIEPISDILLIHPYYQSDLDDSEAKKEYFKLLDDYVDVKKETGKPMLVTETCWGSLDDEWRVQNIRFTLKELKKRDLGWIVHALHHSLVADLHREKYGPVGHPGNLAFIEADGTLRKGHEVFNEF